MRVSFQNSILAFTVMSLDLVVAGEIALDKEVLKKESKKGENQGDWSRWFGKKPGRLYKNKKNPWIQSFEVGGRLHYQFAQVEGNDVNGLDFSDSYDEFRRFRIETKTELLKYFTAEVNLNLVDDTRFRRNIDGELNFGETTYDEVSLEFDIADAFDLDFFDEFKAKIGRMKVRITEEGHTSSKEILTIERSSLANMLGGEARRPMGAVLEMEKGDFNLMLGAFSAEDSDDVFNDWSEGSFYYGSLRWEATKELELVFDYLHNDREESISENGISDALGYSWASALSVIYETDRWGLLLEGIYGDNGDGETVVLPERQGSFYGAVITPWLWLVEDRLQLVLQYQFSESEESQGIQIRSRYIRGQHNDLEVDDDNGRGRRNHSIYGGLNYYIHEENLRILAGVSYDELFARDGRLDAFTYSFAFQANF